MKVMQDEQVEWEEVDIASNEAEWFVLVLFARVAVSLELLSLCQKMEARTGKRRRKTANEIVRLLEGEDNDDIQA